MTLILAFIGFVALTMLICFYAPRCCALATAIYILSFKSGFYPTRISEIIIIIVVFAALAAITIYLDYKNLRLNPFKK
jgi:hypothetical protein